MTNEHARIAALEGFIRDFAAWKFDPLPHPFTVDPQDRPDDVTELLAVWAWQDDARDLLKGSAPEPVNMTAQDAARVLLRTQPALSKMAAAMRNNSCTMYEVQLSEALRAIAGAAHADR